MGVLLDSYKELISKQEDGLLSINEVEEELSSAIVYRVQDNLEGNWSTVNNHSAYDTEEQAQEQINMNVEFGYKTSNFRISTESASEFQSERPKMFITEKTSYGRTLFYPACQKAKTYAETLGRKTLSKSQLKFMEEMGVKVECQTYDYWQSRY